MKNKLILLLSIFTLSLSVVACGKESNITTEANIKNIVSEISENINEISSENIATEIISSENTENDETILLNNIPEYSGIAYVEINNNIPFFTDEDKKRTDAFETYSELDSLGRCGVAYANICKELQPTDKRGEIGSVKPSGWHTVKYNDIIDGNYLYNRCHLIGFQLAGENANEKNLITGTRYLNVVGQLPFENMVDDYVDSSNNHVLYRVTPIFERENLVASGVLMEAWSVEDNGKLHFCVYCYNIQPGIEINYATGDSWENSNVIATDNNDVFFSEETKETENNIIENTVTENNVTYILNTSSKKIHLENCSTISKMSESNKEETSETKEELVNKGYEPCKVCNP